jgi:hypothetical protein
LLARTSDFIAELKADLIARLIETETRERETTRQDISDFLSALSAIVAQSEQSGAVQKPTTKTLREQLAK